MTTRRSVGYRPGVPEHYREGGYGNAPDEAQYEGALFSDGTVACRWLTEFRSTSVWASFQEFMAVHGHADYGTIIKWLDAPTTPAEMVEAAGEPAPGLGSRGTDSPAPTSIAGPDPVIPKPDVAK